MHIQRQYLSKRETADMFDIDMYPLCRVTDTQVYDECFSFLPDAFTGHVTFPSSDAVCVRSRLRLRTICNFPLDIYQEFRDILYPRPVPSRDCRRGERRRDEINLGQSSPFSFREKETTVFLRSHSPRPSPHSPHSNGNRIVTKLRDT